jgi:secretion/DNA translocation related TadE-like protein
VISGRVGIRGDRGQATVAAIGVIAALLTVTVGALDVARAVALSHQARAAADFAALAAAGAAARGEAAAGACAEAARVARANGAAVRSCEVAPGAVVTVTTTRTSDVPWPRTAVGVARAGPG